MFWLMAMLLAGEFASVGPFDQLRWEVGVLDDAGFGGAEIQPFRVGLNLK
jgi:hypothetical protein